MSVEQDFKVTNCRDRQMGYTVAMGKMPHILFQVSPLLFESKNVAYWGYKINFTTVQDKMTANVLVLQGKENT